MFPETGPRDVSDTGTAGDSGDGTGGMDGDLMDTPGPRDVPPIDVIQPDVQLDPDAACGRSSAMAVVERQPVDIIWMVDNSVSMAPAVDQVIRGLNNFANLVGSRGLDYRVVMLSLRNRTPMTTFMGSPRYAICIPMPLAGDASCGNGPRFFHSSIDIRSTQPLDQFLGTLGQTVGYRMGEDRGGEPWRPFLRPTATKTIVVVSDDNSRLSADQFERFAGGPNPNNASLQLPPGILDASWSGLFSRYTFAGLYGWGSMTDPAVTCTYPGGGRPPASGAVYTTLVTRTMGPRAQLCAGAAAWDPFFNAVATAVETSSRISCDFAVPRPSDGSMIDPARVNVTLVGTTRSIVGRVRNAAACTATGGWYFDNETAPTRVFLCPTTCDRAQTELRGTSRGVEVLFGCLSIPG